MTISNDEKKGIIYFVDGTLVYRKLDGNWYTKEKDLRLSLHFAAKVELMIAYKSLVAMKKEYSSFELKNAMGRAKEGLMWLDEIIKPIPIQVQG